VVQDAEMLQLMAPSGRCSRVGTCKRMHRQRWRYRDRGPMERLPGWRELAVVASISAPFCGDRATG